MQPLEQAPPQTYRKKRETSRRSYRLTRFFLGPITRLMLRRVLPACFVIALLGSGALKSNIGTHISHIVDDTYNYILDLPKYQVNELDIQGASPQTKTDILNALSLEFPLSSLNLNLEDITLRTENVPAVKEAQFALPQAGVLQISIVERQPALEWHTSQGRFLLDEEGVTLRPLHAEYGETDLPVISGLKADAHTKEALELFYIWNKKQGLPLTLHRVGERRWNATPKQGLIIMLPEENPYQALAKVISLNQTKQIFARNISAIDMRVPERIILRLAPKIHTSSLRSNLHNIGVVNE